MLVRVFALGALALATGLPTRHRDQNSLTERNTDTGEAHSLEFLSGSTPEHACAVTCKKQPETCAEWKTMAEGCASSCPADKKKTMADELGCDERTEFNSGAGMQDACAVTCTKVPETCAEAMVMAGAGGCASSCPAELKKAYAADMGCTDSNSGTALEFLSGSTGPAGAACAVTCTKHPETCAEAMVMAGAGGCASSCSAEMKKAYAADMGCTEFNSGTALEFLSGSTGTTWSRCAVTCTKHPETCAEAMVMAGAGGCASPCPAEMLKAFAADMGCTDSNSGTALEFLSGSTARGAACAVTCTKHPETCAEAMVMAGAGGCASSCPAEMKKAFAADMGCTEFNSGTALEFLSGSTDSTDSKSGQRQIAEACSATCTERPTNCEQMRKMCGKGGCAETCPADMKARYTAELGCTSK